MEDLKAVRIIIDIPKGTNYISIDTYTIDGDSLQYVVGVSLLYKVKRNIINYELRIAAPEVAGYFYVRCYNILTKRGEIFSELLSSQEAYSKEWLEAAGVFV